MLQETREALLRAQDAPVPKPQPRKLVVKPPPPEAGKYLKKASSNKMAKERKDPSPRH